MTPLLQQKLWEEQTPAQRRAADIARKKRLGIISELPRLRVIKRPPEPEPVHVVEPEPLEPVSPLFVSPRLPAPLYSFGLANDILEQVAKHYGFSVSYVLSKARNVKVTTARHVAIQLISERVGWSMPKLGVFFRRDHTTILHAMKKIARLRDVDPDLSKNLSYLNDILAEKTTT